MRYLLFAYNLPNPVGGMNDLINTADVLQDAIALFNPSMGNRAHIMDVTDNSCVWDYKQ